VTGGYCVLVNGADGIPKPPTVTGVFLFAKMMKTIYRQSPPFFTMDNDIFDGWDSPGGAFHPLVIAVYAFVCYKDGNVNESDIKKAFKFEESEVIDTAISILQSLELIVIVNQ
jgi:hypothetical protein